MSEESIFVSAGDRVIATDLARGPWDPNAQHGGAPAALLMRAFERCRPDADLALARVTYELLRPVPLTELQVEAEVTRPGRRVQLLEGTIWDADGAVIVRARALRIRRAIASAARATPPAPPPPGPDTGVASDLLAPLRPTFATDAMEIVFVKGSFHGAGPASAWFRMRFPVLAGEAISPLQRLAAVGDFGNGISSSLSWDEYLFINPDLTLYVEREPVGEWICLEAETRIAEHGVGITESVLYDATGRVGRATQSLLVAARGPTSAGTP